MSDDEEKKFVMKHTFTGPWDSTAGVRIYGKEETHFGIPWNIYYIRCPLSQTFNVYLTCENFRGEGKWSINVTATRKTPPAKNMIFHREKANSLLYQNLSVINYHHEGNLTIESHVTINKVTGFEIPMRKSIFRSFDDESAKKFSDVVFSVKDQKYYVNKMYMASHSSYFDSLLFGNFDESKQSEVELKDIEPDAFQKFLEVIHGELTIDDGAVKGILQLADMYDAKTAIRHCETFLIKYSKKTLKEKFQMAIQYKLEELKKKCMSEFNNFEDIASIIPEDSDQFDTKIWKELLNLSITLSRKR